MKESTKNNLKSFTGNVCKAVLCVRKIQSPSSESTKATNASSDAQKIEEKYLEKTKSQLNNNNKVDLQQLANSNGFLTMEVQYNPASINYLTVAGRQISYTGGVMGTTANNQMTQTVAPASTTMTVQLIFDDINPYDAFMMDNMNATVGNAVSAVGDLVTDFTLQGYSVQDQLDGLISMMVLDETRQVVFCWSKMAFSGEVTSVNVDYTMFNKYGSPIRGVVSLSIRQEDEGKRYNDNARWGKAFDLAFGESSKNTRVEEKDIASRIGNGNLLNFNI